MLNSSLRFSLTSNWHRDYYQFYNNLLKYGMELLSDMQKAASNVFRGVFLERSFRVDVLSSVCS